MGITSFFYTIKKESDNLINENKYIFLLNNINNNVILNSITDLYVDMPSIIYIIIDKYKEILNNLLKELIYRFNDIDNFLHINILFKKYIIYIDEKVHLEKTLNNILTFKNNNNFLIEEIHNEIFELIINMQSLQAINIFFDGVPYTAKIKKQLHNKIGNRVIKEIYEELEEKYIIKNHNDILYDKYKFDIDISSTISNLVESTIYNKIYNKFNKLIINLNGREYPGESDHKIIDYIKKNNINKISLIFSPDADAIILATYLTNINKLTYVLKYDQTPIRKTNYLLKYYLLNTNYYIKNILSKITCNIESKLIIMDILFLFNLFGNDFIPGIASLEIKKNYKLIFDIYNENNVSILYYEKNIYKINSINFINYIKLLSLNEENRFIYNIPKIEYIIGNNILDYLDKNDKTTERFDYIYIS